ncbi:MAG: coniferyl aldehyde dehydrogenase [Robiginitomaculum sp.]|nr:coniferyl aldehyde dehydrogenase [Robiginitomaculum sp.]MDQ7078458.1 coniferyl aldehyde dehydrogenase [Robiginitomaculum sp.]
MQSILEKQRAAFRAEPNPSYEVRDDRLKRLAEMITQNADEIADTVSEDFGHRSKIETRLADIAALLTEIKHTRAHLKKWMRVERRPVALQFKPAKNEVRYMPKGVVGIISPWNYPFQLAISPLIAALSAGNRAMIKPSELTPRTSELTKRLLGEIFDEDLVAVVTGDAKVAQEFSALNFDHMLFTGSTKVGRYVMEAAAKNLTPVTLELGGKSPTIIDYDYPLKTAAERILSGKLLNSGQTCIAPDYVLTPKDQVDATVKQLTKVCRRFYKNIHDNDDYTAIISEQHFARLNGLIEDAREKGANVIEIYPEEAKTSSNVRKMPPKLVTDVTPDMAIMQEEIFGPLLPLVPYESLDEAIDFVAERPHPLALYVFSDNKIVVERTNNELLAGGVAINDTLMHITQNDLPFGGIGDSGIGAYHGHDGFLTFSHAKATFRQSKINGRKMLFPPYGKSIERVLGFLT